MKALRILMYSSLCFWPLAHLQSESKKPVIVQNKLCLLRSWQCQTVIKSGVICVNLKLLLPLPKCLHTKASPRIIWPHRNIHPHPVSDVGPVPPATHHAGDPLCDLRQCPDYSNLQGRKVLPRGEHVFTHQLVGSFFCMWTTAVKWHLIKCRPSLQKGQKSQEENVSPAGFILFYFALRHISLCHSPTCKCAVLFP